ncbi:MAG: glycosyltransferase [Motiliproteus sp.]
MKRVCLFNSSPIENFHGYHVETFDPLSYFPKNARWTLSDLAVGGVDGYYHRRAIIHGVMGVDRLYRERDPNYMRMIGDFVDRFRDFDLIVMATYNFIHPEILVRELKNPIKVLGFVDDPISTYSRGIPYLWAFDGAFFISPSYIDNLVFDQAIDRWCDKPVTWWPLVSPYKQPGQADDSFFRDRDVDLVYVGNVYGQKMDRLIRLKRHFGSRFRLHGRWPLKGYSGLVRGLLGKSIYPHRVTSLTAEQRTQLYWKAKIGFNMHFSEQSNEAGNMRTYEVPAHGMMMISDKSSGDGHARIFKPGEEAVYYDTMDEAIELIEHYLDDDEARIKVSKAGFERHSKDYDWESNLLRFIDWAVSIKRNG